MKNFIYIITFIALYLSVNSQTTINIEKVPICDNGKLVFQYFQIKNGVPVSLGVYDKAIPYTPSGSAFVGYCTKEDSILSNIYSQVDSTNTRLYDSINVHVLNQTSTKTTDSLLYLLLSNIDSINTRVHDSLNVYILNRDTAIVKVLGLKDTLYTYDLDTSIVLINNDSLDVHILNPMSDSNIVYKIDSTNILLRQLHFEACGGIYINPAFIGYKFNNAVDFACTGGLPSTTEVCDFQHCISSTPAACIPMSNQLAMQSYINSTLIPDLNTCYSLSLVANDIIYLYNSTLDEVEVWYNPILLTVANPPHNFVVAPIGTASSCEKPFPNIPITSSAVGSGNALLVKVCEPLNVVTTADTTHQYVLNEMLNKLNDINSRIDTTQIDTSMINYVAQFNRNNDTLSAILQNLKLQDSVFVKNDSINVHVLNSFKDTTHAYILNQILSKLDSNIIDRKWVSIDAPLYNINETYNVTGTITFAANTIHSYTVIGITGTHTFTEQVAVAGIPSGVTHSNTASRYFTNAITITPSVGGRVLVKINR